jgi:hypothetical protein
VKFFDCPEDAMLVFEGLKERTALVKLYLEFKGEKSYEQEGNLSIRANRFTKHSTTQSFGRASSMRLKNCVSKRKTM